MNKGMKTPVLLPLLISLVTNGILFLFYFLNTRIFDDDVLIYIFHFLSEILSSALPIIIAASLALVCERSRMRNSFITAIPYAFLSLISALPQAISEILASGYGTEDAALLILIEVLFCAIVNYAEYILLFLLIIFIKSKFAKEAKEDNLPLTARLFDFSIPEVLAIFAASAARFIYNLIFELIDTVDYLIRYAGSYRIDEIIYIAVSYLIILASLFIAHASALGTLDFYSEKKSN